jgi:hypothetical protein
MVSIETSHGRSFLPVFSMDWFGLLRRVQKIQGHYGVLAPVQCSDNFLHSIRELEKPFFIDGGIFRDTKVPWYHQPCSEFVDNRWVQGLQLVSENHLRKGIRELLARCQRFSPDYVFAPDVFGEPLLSLYLSQLALEEFQQHSYSFKLIGVVQVGHSLYDQEVSQGLPQREVLLPHYRSKRSFLASLISQYRNLGYEHIALGGLLRSESTMPTGWKFGLSSDALDELLTWSRPDFVLGGLALTRIEVLKKHNVWADSTNWLWWDGKYDFPRFGHRNVLQEVASDALQTVAPAT